MIMMKQNNNSFENPFTIFEILHNGILVGYNCGNKIDVREFL